MPLGCYKHLPGQSASIIIAFVFQLKSAKSREIMFENMLFLR